MREPMQINIFEELERAEEDRRQKETVRDGYRRWLHAPELMPCTVDATPDYHAYAGVIHICKEMPDGGRFWRNTINGIHGGQYWVYNAPGQLNGAQMDVCPYCGADLCHGEGERFLERASGHVYGEASYRRYYGLDEIDQEMEHGGRK